MGSPHKAEFRLFGVVILMLLLLLSLLLTSTEADTSGAAKLSSSSMEDQTAVSITIYNANIGLVRDQRKISLPKGKSALRFMDVAAQIIPSSVHVRSVTDAASLTVLEQNYEYDLLNPQKLLDKYVGKEVKLYNKNPYTEREEVVSATLLSNNGGPIFKIGNEITFGHPGRVIFPGVPDDLIAKPTLIWLLENDLSSPQRIEASYLTNNISWKADYVLTMGKNDDKADLSGWVTLDNRSGASYQNASVKLVAGDINRVKEESDLTGRVLRLGEMVKAAAPQFREETFFEYHLYTLQRPTTIKDNQTKQIQLLSAENISVKKELLLHGGREYYYSRYSEADTSRKVGVYCEIENKKDRNLGMPLPKGTVRVYKHDQDEDLQFIGEDGIDHTPEGEKIRIKLGNAFDVAAMRKQTDWKKLASDTYEAEFEISLRNHKKEAIVVRVIEPIPGDWTMISASQEFVKTSASLAEFRVSVAPDQEAKLRYRVRMRY